MKQKFDITGMSCSACAAKIEKTVSKLDGVSKAEVNLLTNTLTAEFDDSIVGRDNIIKSVEAVGYGAAIAGMAKKETKEEESEESSLKKRFIVSLIFWIPLMYISMFHMILDWLSIPMPYFTKNFLHGPENASAYVMSQFLLLLPIMYVNRKYFISGFKNLYHMAPNMDSLIAVGSGASALYGIAMIFVVGYKLGHGDIAGAHDAMMNVYFEGAATILTLITLGKFLEARSKGKTSEAIKQLMNLAPKTATVIRDGKETVILSDEIKVGDRVLLKPGQRVAADGVIISGNVLIDESSVTGESIPVEKSAGDELISATVNISGGAEFEAKRVGKETTIAKIVELVQEAAGSKAPIARLADKISGIFVPVVMAIAAISFVVWLILGKGVAFSLSMGISVLVISCPCALGLATPVAIMVGEGRGAQAGILIKSASALEMMHKVDCVIFDKTGTITEGKMQVSGVKAYGDETKLAQIALSLEKMSEHPLGRAVREWAKKEGIDELFVDNFVSVFGRGVSGEIDLQPCFGGNAEYMKENGIDISFAIKDANQMAIEGKTPLYFAEGKALLGIIGVSDVIKENSAAAISELKKMGIHTVMLTGDNNRVAESVSKKLDIDEYISQLLPQDKEKKVSEFQKKGKKVMMVGDGINDAPALTRADVGMAIGAGTDIAMESAQVVLVKNNIYDVVNAINLSKAVMKNIRMNLFWAFFYNIIGIPVAAGVLYSALGVRLSPMIAAAAMSLSSVCVVLNALRLRAFKIQKSFEKENANILNIKNEEAKKMQKIIKVEGMHCEHCKSSVEKTLLKFDGVESALAELDKKRAVVELSKDIDLKELVDAINEEGFKASL